MKLNHLLLCFSIIVGLTSLNGQSNESKEVLIIGTMHGVPKILKNAYRPLYKKALQYRPDRIYVESAMPNDSLSWDYLKNGYSKFYRNFYKLADSLRVNYDFDESIFTKTLNKDLDKLSKDDFEILKEGFGYLRDDASFRYYRLLEKYGLQFKKKFRHENQDLTAKLAVSLGHSRLYGTDDQRTNREFQQNWKQCEAETLQTEYDKKYRKISRQLTTRMILPSLFGRYGIANNKSKNMEALHIISGMSYAQGAHESCNFAVEYWNQRNQRIAYNLGTQIQRASNNKNVLIIGAAHVVGVKSSLEEQFPNLKVIILDELR